MERDGGLILYVFRQPYREWQVVSELGNEKVGENHSQTTLVAISYTDVCSTFKRNLEIEFSKLLRSPGINSKESIPQTYVAWRAGTTTLILLGS
jgi:hypothetical protein